MGIFSTLLAKRLVGWVCKNWIDLFCQIFPYPIFMFRGCVQKFKSGPWTILYTLRFSKIIFSLLFFVELFCSSRFYIHRTLQCVFYFQRRPRGIYISWGDWFSCPLTAGSTTCSLPNGSFPFEKPHNAYQVRVSENTTSWTFWMCLCRYLETL